MRLSGIRRLLAVEGFIRSTRRHELYLELPVKRFQGVQWKCRSIAHFFFRRALLLRKNHGCFGFIATNTIAQGDTRTVGAGANLRSPTASIYRASRKVGNGREQQMFEIASGLCGDRQGKWHGFV